MTSAFGGDFGGRKTQRACGLLSAAPRSRPLVMHPTVLGAARAFLAPWSEVLRLHILQAIYLHPGQPAELIHRDRLSFGRHLPRSIEPQINTIWALNRFTDDNGATRVVPGSHRWPEGRTETAGEVVAASMPAGSVLIYTGSVMHRVGKDLPPARSRLRRHGNRLMLPVDPDERAFHEIAELEREDGDAKPILAAAIH